MGMGQWGPDAHVATLAVDSVKNPHKHNYLNGTYIQAAKCGDGRSRGVACAPLDISLASMCVLELLLNLVWCNSWRVQQQAKRQK